MEDFLFTRREIVEFLGAARDAGELLDHAFRDRRREQGVAGTMVFVAFLAVFSLFWMVRRRGGHSAVAF